VESAAPPAPPVDPNPTFNFTQFSRGENLHMIAYGDMRFTDPAVSKGTNPRVRKWLAERIAEEHPQVLLLTGDMPMKGARESDWEDFQTETAGWRADQTLQLPTTGNHEIYGGEAEGIANYLKNFPEIEGHRYYSALLGSVEVISLDCTSPDGISQPQARWFAAQLDHLPRQTQFLFILYHMPWVADRQTQLLLNMPSRSSLVLRGILESRLSRLRARVVVFNGHIHNYERFERNGVEYVVSGGGGAEPYPILARGPLDLYRDKGFPVYHYLTLEVNAGKLHAVMWKVKDPDAAELSVEMKDEFTLMAPAPKSPAKGGAGGRSH
jgi:acid phosphatase type 7